MSRSMRRWVPLYTLMFLFIGCTTLEIVTAPTDTSIEVVGGSTTPTPTEPETPPASTPYRVVYETANADGTFTQISSAQLTIGVQSTIRVSVFDSSTGVELTSVEIGPIDPVKVDDTSVAVWVKTDGRFVSVRGVAVGSTTLNLTFQVLNVGSTLRLDVS